MSSKLKILLLIVAVICMVFILWFVFTKSSFRLTESPNASHPVEAPLVFVYSQELKVPEKISDVITITPNHIGLTYIDETNTQLIFAPSNPFRDDQDYVVEVAEITSKNGAVIEPYLFTISPTFVAFGDQPEHVQRASIAQNNLEESDPLLSILPFENDYFRVEKTAVRNSKGPTLLITTYEPFIRTASTAVLDAQQAEYRQRVIDWFEEIGVSMDDYNIEYSNDF